MESKPVKTNLPVSGSIKVEQTICLVHSEWTEEFRSKYGSHSAPGKLIFLENQSEEFYNAVILQESKTLECIPNCKSQYVHSVHFTTKVEIEGREIFVRVLPYYKETINSYLSHSMNTNVYAIVKEKPEIGSTQIFSFSEHFKSCLLGIFKGIKSIHDSEHVHGNINGDTMILLAVDFFGSLLGRVIGTSVGTLGDPNVDWKAVAVFLKSLLPSKEDNFCKFDSEIEDLVTLLEDDNVTDELVVDHIALWSPLQKLTLINYSPDELLAGFIDMNRLEILGGEENWQMRVEPEIKSSIVDSDAYTPDLLSLVRFVRNMMLHGVQMLPPQDRMLWSFDNHEKGILGMIDKSFPKLFVSIIKEAKKSFLAIPTR